MSGEKEINKRRKRSTANAVWRRQTRLGLFFLCGITNPERSIQGKLGNDKGYEGSVLDFDNSYPAQRLSKPER